MKMLLPAILICFSAAIHASSENQTDWSGGSGKPGPVLSWTDSFAQSKMMNFVKNPGTIALSWGSLTDAATEIENSTMSFISPYAEDVDKDGDIDILVTSALDNKVLWWENLNGADSWQSHSVASDFSGAYGATCADVDNDGDNDIIGTAMNDDAVIWWENTDSIGTTWVEHIIDNDLDGAKGIAAVDINKDGHIDMAVSAKSGDMVVWYKNNGSGSSWTKYMIADKFDCAMSVYPCDFDSDGDWDILSSAKLDGAVRWYENTDGTGTLSWKEHSIGNDLYYARGACAGDIDGDGDPDVLSSGGISKSSGVICWWENTDGTATSWTLHMIDSYFPGPFAILQFDIDQDGDLDAVSGSLKENVICWWENKDSGSSWEKHTVCNFYAPGIVSAADITGDGQIELFSGSLYAFNISWWKIFGYQSEGSLVSSILDTRGDSEWIDLKWTANVPSGTSLGISMRSSWNENDLGEWSDTVYTTPADLSAMINDNDRFVQYCISMQSETNDTTPSMEQIEISWNPLSIHENNTFSDEIFTVEGNPSRNNLTICCRLAAAQTASLFVYDLSGRTAFSTEKTIMNKGINEFSMANLADGLYFAVLKLNDNTITARFTAIR